MALRPGDLKDVVLKKISYDEFEPKTGSGDDVAVIGFYVTEAGAGDDLYSFLNSSIIENRDVEVSPNPNDEGYYMVFVEMDRNDELAENVLKLVREVENLSGKLMWEARTPYINEYLPLEEVLNGSAEKSVETESQQQEIMEFLANTNLLDVRFDENMMDLKDARASARLEVVGFGYGPDLLSDLNINESAIRNDFDQHLFVRLRSMLGEMRALPIDEYVVIYDPARKDVLVTKPC